MAPENILLDFIPDMICLGIDGLICAVLYRVYSKTHQLISAIKVSLNFNIFFKQYLKFKFKLSK
jgi:hypothetical protein